MRHLFAWLFPKASNDWVAVLRVGLGLQLILYQFSLRHDWAQMLSPESRRISEALLAADSPFIPRLSWLTKSGLNESQIFLLVSTVLVLSALLLLAGFLCRWAALAAWLCFLAVVKSSVIFAYGADAFTIIGLVYLALSPLPDRWALDWHWRRKRPRFPALHGFARRALQLHLCVIYFFSGLSKAAGRGWWNGESIWRALTRPPFDLLDPAAVTIVRPLLPAAGICFFLLELLYPILIWPEKTRTGWLLAVIGLHIGIGVFMGMPLFALIMITLNCAAFGPALGQSRPLTPA